MNIRGNEYIQFRLPDDWSQHQEDDKYIYHGPRGQELIISGAAIVAKDKSADRENIKDPEKKLLENAFQAMRGAAGNPELKTIKNFGPDPSCNLPCWTILSQTTNGDCMFFQAVVSYSWHVALVTFETPYINGAAEEFRTFINSIEQPENKQ